MTEEEYASKERQYQIAAMLIINAAASNLTLICGLKPSKEAVMTLLLFSASCAVEGDDGATAEMAKMCRDIIENSHKTIAPEGTMQ